MQRIIKNTKKILRKSLGYLPPSVFSRVLHAYVHFRGGKLPKRLNFNNPRRFSEKIIWLKYNYFHLNAHIIADKIKARDYVKNLCDELMLIPDLGYYSRFDDIDFDSIFFPCVIKLNHGSGKNFIIKNREDLKNGKIRDELSMGLQENYFQYSQEYQYKAIPPRIIIQKYIDQGEGTQLIDYKFFCFHGVPTFVQVDFDRFSNHTRSFYDMNWVLQDFGILFKINRNIGPRPLNFDKMIQIASQLSQGFLFVRVDLYNVNGVIYFGELTFHPGGGFEPVFPDSWDYLLGDRINLQKINN